MSFIQQSIFNRELFHYIDLVHGKLNVPQTNEFRTEVAPTQQIIKDRLLKQTNICLSTNFWTS